MKEVINIAMNKKDYLPKARTDYHPTNKECQDQTESGVTQNIPNPAVDDIVVNNISNAEFDYTQDMIVDDDI